MTWPATDRYELLAAPGGLGFVQDVINTQSAGRPRGADLLSDLESAQKWLDGALGSWAALNDAAEDRIELQERDLEHLRDLRADLHELLATRADPALAAARLHPATVTARVHPDGTVRLEPRAEGWRRVAAVVLIEAFLAQQQDTWRRLKVCRNERCRAAFYDRSRNTSAVWHDVRFCGNAINLRASRARKRKSEAAARSED
ncbi:putative RNA-binding Zn ribbon-like protein [Amycolatopsis echigonensis]|uniref:RNA-binding Zn ribbon-like protein n=1 Tax=Amycolatopsis echigonensis TaxID=2576905 RepID=A0A2N3X1K5_9PSEU|nr:CGNR zinc finger domain-containing protein [Amycolatopsis niigatensis]PKW00003.1 putative RNA-binding Zn ribbon-like protein [Amycolatopsis niigatensis]